MNRCRPARRVAFGRIAGAALCVAETIVWRWLPDGRLEGNEWVCRNPLRADHHAGSMKVNLRTGRWGDFATGDTGGDLIALAAYLHRLPMREAALAIAEMLGVDPHE